MHVGLEGALAFGDMIPESLHIVNFSSDVFHLLFGNFDGFGVSELGGVISKVPNALNVDFNFTVDHVE